MGEECATLTKPSRGLPPTRCVGESGVISSGCSRLELLQLVHQLVEFGVADFRIVEHVIAVLVMANLVSEIFKLGLDIAGRGAHTGLHYIEMAGSFCVHRGRNSLNINMVILHG